MDLDYPYVAGVSFGAVVALELVRRHGEVPQTLIWPALMRVGRARSVPTSSRTPAPMLEVSRLPAAEFVDTIERNMIDELALRLVHREVPVGS